MVGDLYFYPTAQLFNLKDLAVVDSSGRATITHYDYREHGYRFDHWHILKITINCNNSIVNYTSESYLKEIYCREMAIVRLKDLKHEINDLNRSVEYFKNCSLENDEDSLTEAIEFFPKVLVTEVGVKHNLIVSDHFNINKHNKLSNSLLMTEASTLQKGSNNYKSTPLLNSNINFSFEPFKDPDFISKLKNEKFENIALTLKKNCDPRVEYAINRIKNDWKLD